MTMLGSFPAATDINSFQMFQSFVQDHSAGTGNGSANGSGSTQCGLRSVSPWMQQNAPVASADYSQSNYQLSEVASDSSGFPPPHDQFTPQEYNPLANVSKLQPRQLQWVTTTSHTTHGGNYDIPAAANALAPYDVHADVAIQSQGHVVQGQGRHHQGQLQGQVVAATTSNPGAWFSIPFNQQQHQPTLPAQTVASSDCSAGLDRLFPTTFQQDLTKQNNCFVDGSLGQAAGSVMVQSVIRRQYTDTFSVMAAATFTAPVSANSTDSYSAASYCPKTFNSAVVKSDPDAGGGSAGSGSVSDWMQPTAAWQQQQQQQVRGAEVCLKSSPAGLQQVANSCTSAISPSVLSYPSPVPPSYNTAAEMTPPQWFCVEQPPPVKVTHSTSIGKTRTRDKYRTVYTEKQRVELESEYDQGAYINSARKTAISATTGLSERQIKIWFQNRRAKDRRQRRRRAAKLHQQQQQAAAESETETDETETSCYVACSPPLPPELPERKFVDSTLFCHPRTMSLTSQPVYFSTTPC